VDQEAGKGRLGSVHDQAKMAVWLLLILSLTTMGGQAGIAGEAHRLENEALLKIL